MDELLSEINNYGAVKGTLGVWPVAPPLYLCSQERWRTTDVLFKKPQTHHSSRRLSKLEPKDNVDFGNEMQREKKGENVANLVT